jgi:hypothetical protein
MTHKLLGCRNWQPFFDNLILSSPEVSFKLSNERQSNHPSLDILEWIENEFPHLSEKWGRLNLLALHSEGNQELVQSYFAW